MHTLLYIKPYFWCLVPVADSLVPVEEVPPWCRLLTPWCRWLPTWCQWWRCLPGASGGGASLVPVATYLVPVVEAPPWCRWLPTWCQWWRCLPGASGCLPGASGCLPGASGCLPGASGGGASLVPVAAWILARIFTPGHRQGYARQLLSAAGSLASESKFQGEIDRCDYSYYQLFRCSFWVCFYGAVCMLKR